MSDQNNTPLEVLRHHVSGAVERGEAEAIIEVPAIPDYQQAKIDALAFLASLGITGEIKSLGVAETPAEGKDGKPWPHFRWNCEVRRPSEANKGFDRLASFPGYKTGIGNSTFKPRSIPFGESYQIQEFGESYQIQEFAAHGKIHLFKDSQTRLDACRYLKPTPPTLADIIGSYARDYFDAHRAGSFEDWAEEFGYDTDSRKAEETYQACLAQRKPLMELGMTHGEIEKLVEFVNQF